jgi:phosphopantetheine adenylyltransferase / dephospho-CoA kinase
MRKICLTGGMASGKSTASSFLEQKGAYVIDADKLGHRVYDPGTQAYLKVIEAFGADVVGDDNHIDRRQLGGIVFGNPAALKQLTDIVWPEIRRLAEMEIESYEMLDPDAVVVLEAAVLFEAGWEGLGDEIWVTVVDREIAISRAMARDGAERGAIENRLNAQLSNDERVARATVAIYNNGDRDHLLKQLENAWNA